MKLASILSQVLDGAYIDDEKSYDVRKLIAVTFIDERLTFIQRDKKGRDLHMANGHGPQPPTTRPNQ